MNLSSDVQLNSIINDIYDKGELKKDKSEYYSPLKGNRYSMFPIIGKNSLKNIGGLTTQR